MRRCARDEGRVQIRPDVRRTDQDLDGEQTQPSCGQGVADSGMLVLALDHSERGHEDDHADDRGEGTVEEVDGVLLARRGRGSASRPSAASPRTLGRPPRTRRRTNRPAAGRRQRRRPASPSWLVSCVDRLAAGLPRPRSASRLCRRAAPGARGRSRGGGPPTRPPARASRRSRPRTAWNITRPNAPIEGATKRG